MATYVIGLILLVLLGFAGRHVWTISVPESMIVAAQIVAAVVAATVSAKNK